MKTLLATVAVLAALCLPAFAAPIPPSKHVELSCGEYTVYVSIAAKSKDVLRLDIQSPDSEGDMGNTALVVKWGRGGPTWVIGSMPSGTR